MCWSQLTPPFSPEIVPISLGHEDLYVLAVVVNTDYIRRPIMLNQGNRIFVRLEGENQAPDWYRLRDLFTEQAPSYQDTRLPPTDPGISTGQGQYPDVDLVLRGRLLLVGSRGRPALITDTGRTAALAILNSNETPLTAAGSSLVRLIRQMVPGAFGANAWRLDGIADTRRFSARWEALAPPPSGRRLTEARIHVEITPRPNEGDTLLITLDVLLADPRRPTITDLLDPNRGADAKTRVDRLEAEVRAAGDYVATPFVGIGALREIMLGYHRNPVGTGRRNPLRRNSWSATWPARTSRSDHLYHPHPKRPRNPCPQ